MRRLVTFTAFLLLTGTRLSAHDFWLAALSYSAGQPANVTITGNIGETFPVPSMPTTPDRIDIWRLFGPSGEKPLARQYHQEGQSLATRVTLEEAGSYLGVMTILAREIDMTGKEFTDYLKEEGLDGVIAERSRLGETDRSARERYARYAKVVVRNGQGPGAHISRPVGLKAEFVPSIDPAVLNTGGSLSVQLLVEGKPAANAQVTAISAASRIDARTDANGMVTFTIPRAGAWLVKTVHMVRPPLGGTPAVDWESYWVTLAFTVAG